MATLGRLLLVEDNEVTQMVATGILTEFGYLVDIATNGLEALEMVGRTTYRAVLMDCRMPTMDGYQATRELRRREIVARELAHTKDAALPRRLPIIALTAAALNEDRARCLAAGMDDYLTKPIQPDELASTLTRWITGATSSAPELAFTGAASPEQSINLRLEVLRNDVADAMVDRLVTSFLNRAPGYLALLGNAQKQGDPDGLANIAHSLGGAASNLGVVAISILCDELETLAREGQLPLVPNLLGRLRIEIETARVTLQTVSS